MPNANARGGACARRTTLLICASALALSAAPAVSHAQDQDAAESVAPDRVVVTARRREETLQDVPIAVSAISGEALEEFAAPDITYLAQSLPNTTLKVSRGTNSTLTAFIRGVGQQDPVAGFEA
ncbi:MAG: TonB-dependent receptor plug domain-containing protein, partial [Caulobacterales bacterium]|nr:TonB-dependent receptor plug domain-containing protein [Caulobacterales bacterium]